MPKTTKGRRPIKEITDLQSKTLGEIHCLLKQRGFPLTMKELADILGISHASAHAQVGQLVKKGFMTRERKKARELAITDKGVEETITRRER